MPLLIVLGVLAIFLISELFDASFKSKKVFTSKELETMTLQMVGKSEKECKRILRSHTGGKSEQY